MKIFPPCVPSIDHDPVAGAPASGRGLPCAVWRVHEERRLGDPENCGSGDKTDPLGG